MSSLGKGLYVFSADQLIFNELRANVIILFLFSGKKTNVQRLCILSGILIDGVHLGQMTFFYNCTSIYLLTLLNTLFHKSLKSRSNNYLVIFPHFIFCLLES